MILIKEFNPASLRKVIRSLGSFVIAWKPNQNGRIFAPRFCSIAKANLWGGPAELPRYRNGGRKWMASCLQGSQYLACSLPLILSLFVACSTPSLSPPSLPPLFNCVPRLLSFDVISSLSLTLSGRAAPSSSRFHILSLSPSHFFSLSHSCFPWVLFYPPLSSFSFI